jgi:hypothetical protein
VRARAACRIRRGFFLSPAADACAARRKGNGGGGGRGALAS